MNAGQMFMSMKSGVTQSVTPDAMTAVAPAGLQNKSGVKFDNLLGEMRMQADARRVANNVNAAGVCAVSEDSGLPLETSETADVLKLGAACAGTSQVDGDLVMLESAAFDTLMDGSTDALPITSEMYPAEAQMVLAAYAQSSMIPHVNTPSGQEVDVVQNVQPKAAVTDQPIIKTEAPVMFRSSEQRQSSSAQPVEHYARTVQPEQQSARLESVASTTTDRPVATPAGQTYRSAVAAPEQPLTNPAVISASVKEPATQQGAPVITAKPAEPASVPSQVVTAPVVEVATAKPETARQEKPLMPANTETRELSEQNQAASRPQPGRMPSVNIQPDHDVDRVQMNPETKVAENLNQAATVLQARPVRESAPARNEVEPISKQLLQVSPQHQGRLESDPGKEAGKAVVQDAVVPEPLSEASPDTGLPNRAISTSSRTETEYTFALPRPITVSRALSTESSRLASTGTALRQQIISLDIEPPQKQSAEFGTVSATKSETTVTSSSAARAQENGRNSDAVLSSGPDAGLSLKLHHEVALKDVAPGASVAKADETDRQASSDSRSVPIHQLAGRAATQLNPGTDGENARVSSSPLSSKENGAAVQSLVPSGEAMLSSDDSMGSNGDQAGSGPKPDNQMMSHQLHAQAKSENQPVASARGSRFNPEQPRQDLPEQVAHQVRERLGQYELKTGNQQITLTLSPENMGELKMNLNLQGQRLSVEIVTESRTVRDAILQHSDSLKDTLARQNITVESFDVTSNGRGTGNPGQNQDAWREMARQKQQQLWASSAGYALPQINVTVNPAAYQAKNEHAMLDIHY
ncbi:MAG: flagellar hook-length control protein FliK [Geobacteraceae bacterium]|nr:flagellar hook-length control protein FliK [Geobacteraceae bacterium]